MDLFKKQRLQDGYQGASFQSPFIQCIETLDFLMLTQKARLSEKYESNIPLRKREAIKRMSIKNKSIGRVQNPGRSSFVIPSIFAFLKFYFGIIASVHCLK